MTQNTTQQQLATHNPPVLQNAQPERKREIVRVMVAGTPLQYENGKLWPQGPEQIKFAQQSFEVAQVANWIAENPQEVAQRTPAALKYTAEYVAAKKALDERRQQFRLVEMPIECVVGEMNEITGDDETNMPSRIEIFGIPFGLWAERQLTYSARIPVAMCVINTRHPLEEAVEYLEKFHAEDNEEGEEQEEEEEEDEEEETEGDDEDEGPTEPTADDLVVSAAIEAVAQALVEQRDGGNVAIIPMAAWEKVRLAADAWATEREESAGEEEGEEGGEEEEGDDEEEEEDGESPPEPGNGAAPLEEPPTS